MESGEVSCLAGVKRYWKENGKEKKSTMELSGKKRKNLYFDPPKCGHILGKKPQFVSLTRY